MKKLVILLLTLCFGVSIVLAMTSFAMAESDSKVLTSNVITENKYDQNDYTKNGDTLVSTGASVAAVSSVAYTRVSSVKITLNLQDDNYAGNQWIGFLFIGDAEDKNSCPQWTPRTATAYCLRFENNIIFLNRIEGQTFKNHEGDGGLSNYVYGISDPANYYGVAHEYEISLVSNETESLITVKDNGTEMFTAKDTSANRKTNLDGKVNFISHSADGITATISNFVISYYPAPVMVETTDDIIAKGNYSLVDYELENNALTSFNTGVSVVSTTSYQSVKSYKFKMSMVDADNQNSWAAFMLFGDNLTGTGSAPWNTRTHAVYGIRFYTYGIFLSRLETGVNAWITHENGGGMANYLYAINDTAAYYGATHEYEVVFATNETQNLITLKDNGTELFTATDSSANRKSNIDGIVNIITNSAEGVVGTISSFTVTYETEKKDEPTEPEQEIFADSEVSDIMSDIKILNNSAEIENGNLSMNANSVQIAHTESQYENLCLMAEININVSNMPSTYNDWLFFMMVSDSTPGVPTWVAGSCGNRYMLAFYKSGIVMKRCIGTTDEVLTTYTVEADFYSKAHIYKIQLDVEDGSVNILVNVDSKNVMTYCDESENAILTKGAVTFLGQGDQKVVTEISLLKASAAYVGENPEQPTTPTVPTIEMFEDSEVSNIMDNVAIANNSAEMYNGKLVFDKNDVNNVYTGKEYEEVRLMAEIDMDITKMGENYSDWLMFIYISDSTPGLPIWVPESGSRYSIAFYKSGIVLQRYNSALSSVQLATYTVESDFYAQAHTYKIQLDVEDEGVVIGIAIDGTTVIAVLDDSDDAITSGGAVTLLGQGPLGFKAEINSLKGSAAVVKTSDLDFDSIETQLDFTDIADKSNWTGTYQEAEYVEQTIFYKGGTKDNVFLGGVDIKTVGTFNLDYTDFVITFKMTVTWPEFSSDWGAFFTFRDSNPGVAVWGSNQDNGNYNYAIGFYQDAYGVGTMRIERWNAAAQSVTLAIYSPVNLNGVTNTFKLAVKDIDTNNDNVNDAVRIVVVCNEEVIFDVIDSDAEKGLVGKAGGFGVLNHNTRHAFIQGTVPGEAVEELVINPRPSDDNNDDNSSSSGNNGGGYEDDITNSASTGNSSGEGCFGGFGGSALIISLAAMAITVKGIKRRKQ